MSLAHAIAQMMQAHGLKTAQVAARLMPYVLRRWLSRYSCSHARVVRRTGYGPVAVVTVLRRPVCTAR